MKSASTLLISSAIALCAFSSLITAKPLQSEIDQLVKVSTASSALPTAGMKFDNIIENSNYHYELNLDNNNTGDASAGDASSADDTGADDASNDSDMVVGAATRSVEEGIADDEEGLAYTATQELVLPTNDIHIVQLYADNDDGDDGDDDSDDGDDSDSEEDDDEDDDGDDNSGEQDDEWQSSVADAAVKDESKVVTTTVVSCPPTETMTDDEDRTITTTITDCPATSHTKSKTTTAHKAVVTHPIKSCYKRAALTQYWVPKEGDKDMLNDGTIVTLTGSKKKKLVTDDGDLIAKVSKTTYEKFQMEGTGLLESGVLVNLASTDDTFQKVDRKKAPYGLGNTDGATLTPWISVASNDLKHGTILHIKELDGVKLPNGRVHNGCVRVDDEGWSFGGCQLDWFVLQFSAYNKLVDLVPEKVTVTAQDCEIKNYVTENDKNWAVLP